MLDALARRGATALGSRSGGRRPDRRRGAADRDAHRGVASGPGRAAGVLRPSGVAEADPRRRRADPAAARPARTARARPARGAAAGSIRPTTPSGRFGTAAARRSAALTADDLAGPLYLAPVAPELAAAGPWAMPWISDRLPPARRLSVGPRADARSRCATTCSRRRTRSTTRSSRGATPELAGELGDLLLQVVLHAQLAAEEGVFDLTRRAGRPRDARSSVATRTSSARPRREPRPTSTASGSGSRRTSAPMRGETAAAAKAPSTGSARPCLRSPRVARCRSGPPTSATTGRRIEGVLDKVVEETNELREARGRRRRGRLGRGVRRPAVRPRERRAQARRGRGGRDARGQREVPAAVRQRGTAGGRPRRRPARPRLRGARCAMGRGQGRGGDDDDHRQPAANVRRTAAARATCVRSASRSASRNGPRARAW